MSRHSYWAMDVLAADPTITRKERAVLLVLAARAGATTAECWPSEDAIGAVVGACAENVRKTLRLLAERGLVAVTPRPGRTHLYRIAAPVPLSTTPRDIARGRGGRARAISSGSSRDFVGKPARYRATNNGTLNSEPADAEPAAVIDPRVGRAHAEQVAEQHRRAL